METPNFNELHYVLQRPSIIRDIKNAVLDEMKKEVVQVTDLQQQIESLTQQVNKLENEVEQLKQDISIGWEKIS